MGDNLAFRGSITQVKMTRRQKYSNVLLQDYVPLWFFFFCFLFQGTPALSQSIVAADLLKGTITKLATEDLGNSDKARDQLAKGHVIYEGKSGHILSYDGEHSD